MCFVRWLYFLFCLIAVRSDECQFLTQCKCTNFPLFTLLDSSYLSKSHSPLNQDLFCTFDDASSSEVIFEKFKYFYFRFRTLTFANFPLIRSGAFRFVHFESQTVKNSDKENNRNVIALINVEKIQSDVFHPLNLPNSNEQLTVSFLDSPRLIYAPRALAELSCYELKLKKTNSKISVDFFRDVRSIEHLIIENPSFDGFCRSSETKSLPKVNVRRLTISEISVSHLRGKHFPVRFDSVNNLTLINRSIRNGFRSWNTRELSQSFPRVRYLNIFSRSIQRLTSRMFEDFHQLEYLIVNGIDTVENNAFSNLFHLKELNLGENLRQLDPYAFLRMRAEQVFLDRTVHFRLNDDKDFCTFAQLDGFVRFSTKFHSECSCTLRFLYRNLEKTLVPLTPPCFANASVYVLTQEERICYFKKRLTQCDVLPEHEFLIDGQMYNASYFYQENPSKQRKRFSLQWLTLNSFSLSIFFLFLLAISILFRLKKRRTTTYRHLQRLLQRRQTQIDRRSSISHFDSFSPSIRTTKV